MSLVYDTNGRSNISDTHVHLHYFFHTRNQYDALEGYVDKLNRQAYTARGTSSRNWGSLFDPDPVSLYAQARDFDAVWRKLPKRKIGKKKYEVRVSIDKILYHEGIADSIESLGLEPKPKGHNKPRYAEDDLTIEPIVVKSTDHFRKLTRLMNKDYGRSKWHLRGARKLQKRLKTIETARELGGVHASRLVQRGECTQEEFDKGIAARVCVVGEAPTLKRKIFQLELMT